MIIKDFTLKDNNEYKVEFMDMIRIFSQVPINKTSLIVNAIASYYARKYLNRNLNAFTELPTQDVIDNMFSLSVNFINDKFIIDRRLVLKRILDYIKYYKNITFHEYVPDKCNIQKFESEYKDIDHDILKSYYTLGYNQVLSIREYVDIMTNQSLYASLAHSVCLGLKYLKPYIS